ncbi:MAG TPA: hypothetical protein VH518_07775 [Tepidisphaeraceae bacterium]
MARKTTTAILRMEYTLKAKKQLEDLSERHGMTQISMASRLTAWFIEQDPIIQAAVLARFPAGDEAEVARIILRRMADASRKQ